MEAGEEMRFYCSGCQTEFDLTLEPKAKESRATMPGKATPEFCPWCGEKGLEES